MIIDRIIAQSGHVFISSADRESRAELVRKLIAGAERTKWAIYHYQITLACVVLVLTIRHAWDTFTRSRRAAKLSRPLAVYARAPTVSEYKARERCRDRDGSDSLGSSTTLMEDGMIVEQASQPWKADDRTTLLPKPDRKVTLISRLRSFLMYQPRPIPFFNKTLPENATTLLILALLAINIYFTVLDIVWEIPLMYVFSDRTSLIFAANLPWLYILGAKNQPLRLLTGHSYEHLNILHRRLGEWLCFVALLHAGSMFMTWYTFFRPNGGSLQWFLAERTVYIGLITLALYETLYATSLASFRRWWYELFLGLHVGLQAGALGFLYFHHRGTKSYVRITLAIFLLDRLVFRLLAKTRSIQADIKLMPDRNTVLLSANWVLPTRRRTLLTSVLPHPILQGWSPAAHIFVTIPSLGHSHALQAHPFTIASAAPAPTDSHAWLNLIIRALDGFTHDLLLRAHTAQTLKARLDGPYGSSHALDMLRSNAVAVALVGGSGVAVAYPLLWALLHPTPAGADADADPEPAASRPKRRIALIWIVHQAEHVEWIGHERLDEMAALGLKVVLPAPTREAGRPDVEGLVRGAIEEMTTGEEGESVGVLVSGPDGMNRAARNCCARMVREGLGVEVRVEKFGW